jgi:hypothetical protein
MWANWFVVKNWPKLSCPKLTWLYSYTYMRSDNANEGLIVIGNFYSTEHSFLKHLVQFNWSLVFKCQRDLHFFLENQRFQNKMIEFAHHCFQIRKYYLYEKNGRRFLEYFTWIFHWTQGVSGLDVLKPEKAPFVLVSLLANKKSHFVARIKYSSRMGQLSLPPKLEKTTTSCETEAFSYSVRWCFQNVFLPCCSKKSKL